MDNEHSGTGSRNEHGPRNSVDNRSSDGQNSVDTPLDQANIDARVEKIIHSILNSERMREGTVFSDGSYSSQHILQKGSDWRRSRAEGQTGNRMTTRAENGAAKFTAHDGAAGHGRAAHKSGAENTQVEGSMTTQPNRIDQLSREDRARLRAQARESASKAERPPRNGSAKSRYVDVFGDLFTLGTSDYMDEPGDFDARDFEGGDFEAKGFEAGDFGSAHSEPTSFESTDFGSSSFGFDHFGATEHRREAIQREALPEPLQKLRDMENERTENGNTLSFADLFIKQAKLTANYEDDYSPIIAPPNSYLPTYQHLSNVELRSYFSWRTLWRHGSSLATPVPKEFASLLAFELINGVGCKPGKNALKKLQRLQASVEQSDDWGQASYFSHDLERWIRDYVLYHRLDPKLVVPEAQQQCDHAVMTLRRAESAILHQKGIDRMPDEIAPTMPADEELWNATKQLCTFDVDRSPFLRENHESATKVWSRVFSDMCIHCARRRKVRFLDGMFGPQYAMPYTLFVGVPTHVEAPQNGTVMRLTEGQWLTYRLDRWKMHYPSDRRIDASDMSKLLRAIDRQMRLDWDYKKPLKPRPLPQYQQAMVRKRSEEVRQEEVEQQKKRIVIDFSQLGKIRAAAATTREALLVDEEREGYIPEEAVTSSPGSDAFANNEQVKGGSSSSGPKIGTVEKNAEVVGTKPEHVEEGVGLPGPKVGLNSAPAFGPASLSFSTPSPVSSAPTPGAATATASLTSSQTNPTLPLGLTPLELEVARRILDGEDPNGPLGPTTPSLEMVVDSINEKLFDEIGDTVFEFGDNGPSPVEDYVDNVRGILAL